MVSSATLMAETTTFSYNPQDLPVGYVGLGTMETFDVAIRLDDPALVGKNVIGLSVPLPLTSAQVDNTSAFLTSKFRIQSVGKETFNNPDILSQPADISGEGILTATFNQPYTIEEGGVIVGYSFRIIKCNPNDDDDMANYPLACVEGDNSNGMYLHTSSTTSFQSFTSLVSGNGIVSPMKVFLEGDFPTASIELSVDKNAYFTLDNPVLPVTLKNTGLDIITDITYTYTIGSQTGEQTYALPAPLLNTFGYSALYYLPVPGEYTTGSQPYTLSITKANGKDISAPATAEGNLGVSTEPIVNRPLVEEFTGLWCGWCPRGFVALETLGKQYGDEFVALAFHNGDPMATASRYPVTVSGYPLACVNRASAIDPGDIEKAWNKARLKSAPANIRVSAEYADEQHTRVKATAKVKFLLKPSSAYKLSFALVGDGMTDPDWGQTNYYSNRTDLTGEFADVFNGGPRTVYGLEFNDVVLYYPKGEYKGITGSLPAADNIEPGEEYTYEYEFDLADVKNLNNASILEYAQKLRVVAILNGTKYPENSATSKSLDVTSGINDITGEGGCLIETIWHDLAGRRVFNPDKGLYIRTDIYSNGARHSSKVRR